VALAADANVGSWRIMERIGMRRLRTGTYFGMADVRKYEADAAWWSPIGEEA
jgi:RimJ/RimL family protein N-acetyltransferase